MQWKIGGGGEGVVGLMEGSNLEERFLRDRED